MAKVPFTNDTPNVVHVGGVTIPPFDTREVEETHLPGYAPDEPREVAAAPKHIVDVLLAGDVATLLPHLPVLADGDLALLQEGEAQSAAREDVLAAITQERLARSATGAGETDPLKTLLSGSVAAIAEALPGLSDEQLAAVETLEAADRARKGVAEAIAAERLRRAADGQGA